MDRLPKLFFVFLFAAGSFAGLSQRSFFVASEIEAAGGQKDLYLQSCAKCHGADGKPQTELGQKLDAADLTVPKVKKMGMKKMTRVISNGGGGMPAFRKKLSQAQIASLATYVKSL